MIKFYTGCILAITVLSCQVTPKDYTLKEISIDLSQTKEMGCNDIANFGFIEEVNLETSDSSLIGAYPSLLENDSLFVSFRHFMNDAALLFNKEGKFIRKIGDIGEGPSEYIGINDIALGDSNIYLLDSNQRLLIYTDKGTYVDGKDLIIPPANSFIKHPSNFFLYCIGNNKVYGKETVYKTSLENITLEKLFPEDHNLLPIQESNFTCFNNKLFSYRKSLSSDVYTINCFDSIQHYRINIPGYNLPESIYSLSPLDVMNKLQEINYSIVKFFTESDRYIYMNILLYRAHEANPSFYSVIIHKASHRQFVLLHKEDIHEDAFIYYPQYIDPQENIVYIGYDVNENSFENNPSIFKIALDNLESYYLDSK